MFLKPAGEGAVGVGERVGQREWGVAVSPKSCSKWEVVEKRLARCRSVQQLVLLCHGSSLAR